MSLPQPLDHEEPVSCDPLAGLLHRVARQDRMAFHELYLSTSARLYGIAVALTRDRQVAAEALQDAMVQVWRNATGFDPLKGSGEAWMTGILRHRVLDGIAQAGRRNRRHYPIDDAHQLPDESALEKLEASAAGSRLRRCMAQLETKNRDSIVLAYVHGYSHSQIAQRLELPLGTIKAWIRRGLAALKACVTA